MAVSASGNTVDPFTRTTTPEVEKKEPAADEVAPKAQAAPVEVKWWAKPPARHKPYVPPVGSFAAAMANDVSHDGWVIGAGGRLYPPKSFSADVPGLKPLNGKPIRERVVWVNGIMTPTSLHQQDMQAFADTGREVVGIHNATQGMFRDLSQCLMDKLDLGENPAVETTKRAILDAINENRPLHLVGHSQGALICARALFDVRNSLMLERGMNAETAEATLSNIKLTTLGGASMSYPDGPRYDHWLGDYDGVSTTSGLGAEGSKPGKGAVIHHFKELNSPKNMPALGDGIINFFARFVDRTVHGPQDVYLKHLIAADAT